MLNNGVLSAALESINACYGRRFYPSDIKPDTTVTSVKSGLTEVDIAAAITLKGNYQASCLVK